MTEISIPLPYEFPVSNVRGPSSDNIDRLDYKALTYIWEHDNNKEQNSMT